MSPPPRERSRRRSILSALLTLAAVLATASSLAAFDLEERVTERTLGNGMRVLVLPRRQSPIVSLSMKFRAGSVDEAAGRSGTAHLLEHLMFKGTTTLGTRDWAAEKPLLDRIDEAGRKFDALRRRREREGEKAVPEAELAGLEGKLRALEEEERRYVVKDEIDSIYSRNGAEDFNASTGFDLTTYRVDLPANRLPLWAAIETDRMSNPVLREFYSERDVVLEERRQSYDSQPDRLLMEQFLAAAYTAHPYGRPVIGWMDDIRWLPPDETGAFFRRYYTPGNAVLAVVGDVDPSMVLDLLERTVGAIPSAPGDAGRNVTREPEQRGERRVVLEADAGPLLMIGWHKPTLPHRDDYVLDLIDGILGSGRTSRLWRRLVDQERTASSINVVNGLPGARDDNLFAVIARPLPPRTSEEVEKLVYEELARLAAEPVPPEELAKVKNRLKADFIRGLQSNSDLADTLSYFEALAGGWRYITRHAAVLESITSAEVMETARRYFTPENRTVAILRKAP